MNDRYFQIGQRIAGLRRKNHITQEKFAEIMDISVKHCSEVERGLSSLSLEKLIFASDFFDCSMDYLIHGTNPGELPIVFPNSIIEIMRSDDAGEKALLDEYLRMYVKLRPKRGDDSSK